MRSQAIEEYKKILKLSEEQREVLIGILLGDAHLETQNQGRTYRLKVQQSVQHKSYVMHLYRLFQEWVRTEPQSKVVRTRGNCSEGWWFQTYSHGAFRFYASQFYCDRKKKVPELIHKWLTPAGIAYWFMDDGSQKSSQSKAVIFNTQGFKVNEVERLCSVLNSKFRFKSKLRRQEEGFQIYISGESYELFKDIVEPHIIPEMKYKIPKARLT